MGVVDIYKKLGNTLKLNGKTIVDAINEGGGSGGASWTKHGTIQEVSGVLPSSFNELCLVFYRGEYASTTSLVIPFDSLTDTQSTFTSAMGGLSNVYPSVSISKTAIVSNGNCDVTIYYR